MTSRIVRVTLLFLIVRFCIAGLGGHGDVCNGAESQDPKPAKEVFFNIPHSHWEGAVFETREEYLDFGLPIILRALRLLKAYPNYRFTLDQACFVKPFLERYPEEEATFKQFVREGRLAIVGGMDVMPDVNMPGGESFVRQILYGKGYFRKKLNVDVTVAWQIDTFGHHSQIPQLLNLAGYKSFWFVRGVADRNTPSELVWEGLDGSRIPAFWLPHSYGLTFGSPKDQAGFNSFMKKRFDMMGPFSRGSGRVGLAGPDVTPPEEHVPALLEQFNHQTVAPFELRFAVPTDFEKLVATRTSLPVMRGELNPIFQGTYSSRIELKQRTRDLERLLTSAEKLGAMLQGHNPPVDNEILEKAWEPMLFNHAHDLMSGVMTEKVYLDTVHGYDFAKRIAEEQVQERLRQFTARVDTRGEGVPVVVYNMLNWPRTDVAVANLGFSASDVMDLEISGPDGKPVPLQLLRSRRNAAGGLLRAEFAFIAQEVPAMGFAVYHVRPTKQANQPALPQTAEPILENEHYRLEFDPAGGAITRLLVKAGNWEALRAPGNVVAREEDRGDLWELYKTLDAGSYIAMNARHPAPVTGKAVFSSEQSGQPGTVARGPVFSEFKVAHPFGKKGKYTTAVRVYAGLRRIDLCTKLVNDETFVRYRVLFPTSIVDGDSTHEIPFGAIRRPEGIEFPAQNWIDYGNGQRGIALLNRGLPGNNVADGTMMLSLLRSTRIVAYSGVPSDGYAAGTDSSLELNREHSFDYALVPHAGDWRQAGSYREAMEFNHPLLTSPTTPHAGALPSRWGLLTVEPDNLILTAIKPAADGSMIVRIYEAAGKQTAAKLRLNAEIAAAEEVNLMEDRGHTVSTAAGELRLEFRPFEIKTLKIKTKTPVISHRG